MTAEATGSNAPGGSPATPQNPAGPTQTPASQDGANSELKKQIDDLMKRLDDQSRYIGRLDGDIKKLSTPKPDEKPKGTGNPEFDAIHAEIEALRKQNEELAHRDQATKKRAGRANLKEAMIASGVDTTLVDMAIDSVMMQHGERFYTETDETNAFRTTYRENETASPVDVNAWVQNFLATPKGARLMPAKSTPKGNTFGNGAPGRKVITKQQLGDGSVTAEDLKTGDYTLEQ